MPFDPPGCLVDALNQAQPLPFFAAVHRYPSILGIKIVNLVTNQVSAVLGKQGASFVIVVNVLSYNGLHE